MAESFKDDSSSQSKLDFWQSHIDAWLLTGLSQAEYCRQNHLKSGRFTYWKRKLNHENLSLELVQVPTDSESLKVPHFCQGNAQPIRLRIDSRITIEIPDGFLPATLKAILSTLEVV